MIYRLCMVVVIAALMGLPGCATSKSGLANQPQANGNDRKDVSMAQSEALSRYRLILTAVPVAISLDGQGPDTVGVNIYLYEAGKPKSVPIREGEVRFVLFDGIVGRGVDVARADADIAWTRSVDRMAPYGSETQIGWVYRMPLSWGANGPKSSRVTVAAIYHPTPGVSVASATAVISVNQQ